MSKTLAATLLADALQRLEALQHNENEVLSDVEHRKRAEEVAESSLRAIAVCAKYILSRNGDLRIDGFGDFYLSGNQIEFIPDDDVLQYALLKHHQPEQLQLALRNAFVRSLSQANALIALFDLAGEQPAFVQEGSLTPEEKLLQAIFGDEIPNDFDRAISRLLNTIVSRLREAGVAVSIAEKDTEYSGRQTKHEEQEAQPGVEKMRQEVEGLMKAVQEFQKKTKKIAPNQGLELANE